MISDTIRLMRSTYEQGKKRLHELGEWYGKYAPKQSFNEAQTRLQVIDTLFFECLDWEKDEVRVEDRVPNVGYADYVFLSPTASLIIEAKREGKYFNLPANSKSKIVSIGDLIKHDKNTKDALEQVAPYCQSSGVVLGGICNGPQLVIFVATRTDGIRPLEGKAIAFTSFEEMEENFSLLWDACSKPGVISGQAQRFLTGGFSPVLPSKLSAHIYDYPGAKIRNTLQVELQSLTDLVLEDLIKSEDQKKFLEECYCSSGALSQYSVLSKDILQQRYVNEGEGPNLVKANTKEGISKDILHSALTRRPVLLIGDAGVGKTSFILNLILIDAASYFNKNIALYLDLGSKAALTTDIRKAIIREIKVTLYGDYQIDIDNAEFIRSAYSEEIKKFQSGIYGNLKESNPELYQEKELSHLASLIESVDDHIKHSVAYIQDALHKQIAVFIDNTDQRSSDDQQAAFLIAQEIAEVWGLNVFISLRPETFHSSIKSGALSGYHTKAFTIAPPRIDKVLDKRLAFGVKLVTGGATLLTLPEGISINLDRLKELFEIFRHSLAQNKALVQLIDNLSYGNVRQALEMVRNFFGSGHTNTGKILELNSQTNKYTIPLHEFLRAITYGDHYYYHPDRSPLTNIFDLRYPDGKDHFTIPVLISLLHSLSKSTGTGFVESNQLISQMQTLGYAQEFTAKALSKCVEDKLVELSVSEDRAASYRVTAAGVYHTEILARLFAYIDAVVVDTPILHQISNSMIKDIHSIDDRLLRADYFVEYLNEEWKNADIKDSPFNWRQTYRFLENEIQGIMKHRSNIRNKSHKK